MLRLRGCGCMFVEPCFRGAVFFNAFFSVDFSFFFLFMQRQLSSRVELQAQEHERHHPTVTERQHGWRLLCLTFSNSARVNRLTFRSLPTALNRLDCPSLTTQPFSSTITSRIPFACLRHLALTSKRRSRHARRAHTTPKALGSTTTRTAHPHLIAQAHKDQLIVWSGAHGLLTLSCRHIHHEGTQGLSPVPQQGPAFWRRQAHQRSQRSCRHFQQRQISGDYPATQTRNQSHSGLPIQFPSRAQLSQRRLFPRHYRPSS